MKESPKITEEYLKSVKYGDFAELFKELGIESVWKPGTKKDKLVAEALKQLRTLADLKKKGLTEDDAAKQLEIETAKRLEKEEKARLKKIDKDNKKQAKDAENKVEKVVKQKFTKVQLEAGIKNINANLKNAPSKAFRHSLLTKKNTLLAALEEKE
jgi:hypothetical protein